MGIRDEEYGEFTEGGSYDFRVDAKGARGEGIGKIGSLVVLVKNGKTRIGNTYKVKLTKIYRTFAYAEVTEEKKYQIIGNGSILEI